MGKAKANEPKKYTLTTKEFTHIKTLNTVLSYSIGREQLVSECLHMIASFRLGYPEEQDLQFEIDLNSDNHELVVTPMDLVEATQQD